MKPLSNKNITKLNTRMSTNSLRSLGTENNLIDFSSNDYLGFARTEAIFDNTHQFLVDNKIKQNGATGSRLLSGNHKLYTEVETTLCEFHESEGTLIFNSGYDANIGFFSSVPLRGDIIFYDEFIHASIRDGIAMSNAKSYKFKHNDLNDLKKKCQTERSRFNTDSEIYIVTESVFSMDGDNPDLIAFAEFCSQNKYFLVVDEAHATGVIGSHGNGEVQRLKLQDKIFARIITFGKALGCHGAAVLGSKELRNYLINFSRSFIYTTALPPHSLATILSSYKLLVRSSVDEKSQLNKLQRNIHFFKSEIARLEMPIFGFGEISKEQWGFINSDSAIHCCIISGNEKVKSIAQQIQEEGFDVKAILSPSVPKGQERLRFCLHSYNINVEITEVLELLHKFIH